ncbi:acyl-CoA dehydrogenase family protein [Ramlibacter sp.]|uniref:acyl-CoA dehydrogenase family protein n=1 Tax=Ramlibacter sp. TaxID=1917967 RepID=UPI003D0D3991
MDLGYSPAHEAFRAEVRAFLTEHAGGYPPPFGVNRPTPEARAWQALLIERGYAARSIPREYGGFGAEPDILKSHIVAEEFARARAPWGLVNQGISMLVPTLLELGTEEQKLRWVAPTLRGEVIWCQGYSEPGAGSDLASLKTSATEDGDDFVINGQKIWTTTAHAADMMFALVRTERDAPNKYLGLSYLLLSMRTPGLEVRPLKTMTGASEFNEVFFTDVRVPKSQVVGERGQGWAVSNATLKHERGMLGDPNASMSRMNSILELMQTETLDGVRAIDLPALRQRAMRLQGRVMAMQYHGMRLLTASAQGRDAGIARLVVKLQATELNYQLSALAVDVMGEMGLLVAGSAEARAHGAWPRRNMFDIGMIIGGGTAQIQKNIIAERGLGMPREPKTREGRSA